MHLFYSSRPLVPMKVKGFLTTLALLALFCLPGVTWSAPLTLMAGAPSGSSYTDFARQATQACQTTSVQVLPGTGSLGNLEALNENRTHLGFTQLDALALYGKVMDLSNVKVLVPVFPEALHFVTRTDFGKKEGGFAGVGGKTVVLSDVASLKGRVVGAAGGSFVTLQVLQQLGLGARVIENRSGASDVLAKISSGEYDAGLLVGAAPLSALSGLQPETQAKFKLLPVPPAMAESFKRVYTAQTAVAYRHMGQGATPVPTVAVMAAIVTQNYGPGKVREDILAFRDCVLNSAPSMVTTVGSHPAWREVKPGRPTAWPQYGKD